jgi:virginiamycin B lyase
MPVVAAALVAFLCALGGAGTARSQNIVFGADGNLWFSDGGVVRMTQRGVVKHFVFPGRLRDLQWRDLAAGPDGNLWLVGWSNVIMRLSPTGAVTTFPQGEKPESCSECTAGRIVAGPDGNLWVGVADWNRIWRISPAGAVSTFVLPGVPESLNPGEGPDAMTAGLDGNVWFMRPDANRIGRISPSGVVQEFPVQIDRPGQPQNEPGELTAGPDGNMWFTAPGRGLIGRITPAGVVTTYPVGVGGPLKGGPRAITTGPDGNLWFTAPEANRIGWMSPEGSVRLFRAPFGGPGPGIRGITVGPDGNLWFSEPARGRIARITSAGVVAHIPPTPVIGAVRPRGASMIGVRLRCSAAAIVDCRGALSVDVIDGDGMPLKRVGQRRFSLAPSQAGYFWVQLIPTARQRLASQRHLRLRVVAGPRLVPIYADPGPSAVGAVEHRVTVRLRRRARREQ